MDNSTKFTLTDLLVGLIDSNQLNKPTLSHSQDRMRLVRVVNCLIENSENIDESDIKQICEDVFPQEKRYLLDNPDILISPLLSHIRNAKEIIETYINEVEHQ